MSASNKPSENPSGNGNHDDSLCKFRRILDHQGPIKSHDPNYKGSGYNLWVEWDNGERTYEPLNAIAADDPLSVAKYGNAHNLLDQPDWKRLKHRVAKLAKQKISANSLAREVHQIPKQVRFRTRSRDGDELPKMEAHNHTLVGTIIRKEFNEKYYEGQVTKYDTENNVFIVDYLDSDWEEMSIESVMKYRKQIQAFDLEQMLRDDDSDDSDDVSVREEEYSCMASKLHASDLEQMLRDDDSDDSDDVSVREEEYSCMASKLHASDLDGSKSESDTDKGTSNGGFDNEDKVERGGSKSKDRTSSFCTTTTMNTLVKAGAVIGLVGIVLAFGRRNRKN